MQLHRLLPCAAALGLSLSVAAQTVQTVPVGFTATECNSSTSYPWNTTTLRVQMCYDSTHINSPGPVIIQRLRWRANGSTTATWTGRTYTGCVIKLSSCQNDWSALSATAASNTGADVKTVFSGNVVVKPQTTAGGSPNAWYVDVTLTTPFLYDPSAGKDLLVDVGVNNITGGTSYSVDGPSGTQYKCSRRYDTTSATATTLNSSNSSFAPVMEVTWIPAKGLYSDFSASPTIGSGPLKVQFTDRTFTSNPPVKTWAWDFDGDNKIDSTLQNPVHTYPSINKTAQYSVTLTTTDGTNPASKKTKTNFITVDPPPVANFTATPTLGKVPLIVQFTDSSVGATTWAWDFNNDNTVDATTQNPVFPYTKPGVYSVKLTVTGVGGQDSITKLNLITAVGATSNTLSPSILQYQFNEVRTDQAFNSASTTVFPTVGKANTATWQAAAGRAGYSGPEAGAGALGQAVIATGAATKFSGDLTIMWWQKMNTAPGTTLGYFWGNGTFRCFTGGVAGTSLWFRGTGLGDIKATTNVQADNSWHHCALVIDDTNGAAMWYIDGKLDSTTNFSKGTFSYSSTTKLTVGASNSTTPSATKYYLMDDFRIYAAARTATEIAADSSHEVATTGSFDTGCAGTLGNVEMGANAAPVPGTATFALNVANAENGKPGVIIIGLAAQKLLTVAPLPLSLDFLYGANSGCNLHVDFLTAIPGLGNGNTFTVPLPLPSGLEGTHIYAQWLGFGSKGAVSPGLDINLQKK